VTPTDPSTSPDDNPKTIFGLMKPSTRAIPPIALLHLGAVMESGARKYGRFNWREHTVTASVYTDAIMRHLLAYIDGQDADPESGLEHLAHIMACCALVLDAKAMGKLNDDRKTGPAPRYLKAAAAGMTLPPPPPLSPLTVTAQSLLAIAEYPDSVVHRDLRKASTAKIFLPPLGAKTLTYQVGEKKTEMLLKKPFRPEDLDYVGT
jgi:hypothetical protein